ncbi:hypothetical protein VTK73DRAFT_4152 [Phialemonium thermophilum]|uniref:Uncharacterized protein n=1 Tax=Phialemonium thermophilum TaxID=223376 RepID=A0ABR3Y0H1_9PEZI
MIRKRKASDDINPPADNSSTSPAAPKSSVRSRALYGKLHIDKEGRGKYQDTRRFQDWLSAARSNTEPDDFFHRWLHQDEEQRQYNLDETVDGAVNPVDIDSQAMACHNQVEHNHTDTSVFDRGKTRVQELGTEFKRLLMKPIKKKRSATALLNRFETGLFSEHTESTPTCSCKEYLVQVDGTTVLLELWDMPGEVDNEVSSTLMGHFFHGVMLCFSLESDDNLDAVVNRWPTELQIHLIHAPVFLVGLKRDLRPAYPTLRLRFLNEPSPVSQDLGKQAAVEMHACGYFECSSKAEDDDSVEETFEAVIRSIIQNQDTEDRKRKERIRHERALEFTRQTRRQVSALLCGVLL